MWQHQYPKGHKYYDEEFSEYWCVCGVRVGRWCEGELSTDEVERMKCKGILHGKIVNL